MSDTRRLDAVPEMGLVEEFAYHHDDSFTIATLQDAADIVADAKGEHRLYDEHTRWNTKEMGMNRVMRVPMVIYMELVKSGAIRDQEALKRFINDPDNAVFRTRPGRV